MLMATILVKLYGLREGQVCGLLAEQRAFPHLGLEQLALRFRLITAEDAERARGLCGALAVPPGQPKPLGHSLLEAGMVDGDQLVWALAEQRRTGERLGAVVVRQGWVTDVQLEMMLTLQRREGRALAA